MIRYNKWYNFSDTWNNGSSNDVYINNFVVDFENPAFLDS
jgi:hypothetical protein